MSAEDFTNMMFDKIDVNGDGEGQRSNLKTTATLLIR